MPELPEVETTRRGIKPYVVGERVERLVVRNSSLRWPVPQELAQQIQGSQVLELLRRGKYLLFGFSTGTMIIHLGMSGSLRIVPTGQPAGKHDHLDIGFCNGQSLRYTDPRRFGAVLWIAGDPLLHPLLKSLGPEPLSADFDAVYLYQKSRGRTGPIKNFIMNSQVVVGVGNIYANEALFKAGIRPQRAAGKVSLRRMELLVEAIKQVLAQAIEMGGTTLRDFVGGDGKPGYFKQSLCVYGRAGQACVQCASSLIESRLGQRSSVYCPRCQR